MSDSIVHHAILQAIRADRDADRRWDPARLSLASQLEISEEEADEVRDFIEVSDVDQTLRDACNAWASALDPDWRVRWNADAVRAVRLEAFERKRRAVKLLTQYCHCTESQGYAILRLLESGAKGGRFYTITRRWARALGVVWQELVAAAIGAPFNPDHDRAIGQTFTDLLARKNLSDEEFAARAGTDAETVREFKSGRLIPIVDEAIRFARALEMAPHELIAHLQSAIET